VARFRESQVFLLDRSRKPSCTQSCSVFRTELGPAPSRSPTGWAWRPSDYSTRKVRIAYGMISHVAPRRLQSGAMGQGGRGPVAWAARACLLLALLMGMADADCPALSAPTNGGISCSVRGATAAALFPELLGPAQPTPPSPPDVPGWRPPSPSTSHPPASRAQCSHWSQCCAAARG
jgi:hypothetical protein